MLLRHLDTWQQAIEINIIAREMQIVDKPILCEVGFCVCFFFYNCHCGKHLEKYVIQAAQDWISSNTSLCRPEG